MCVTYTVPLPWRLSFPSIDSTQAHIVIIYPSSSSCAPTNCVLVAGQQQQQLLRMDAAVMVWHRSSASHPPSPLPPTKLLQVVWMRAYSERYLYYENENIYIYIYAMNKMDIVFGREFERWRCSDPCLKSFIHIYEFNDNDHRWHIQSFSQPY